MLMNGDIRPPHYKKPRPLVKPKPTQRFFPPPVDSVINEFKLESPNKTEAAKKSWAPHTHLKRFWRWWLGLNRNERFGIIAVALLLFGVASVLWVAFIRP